MKNFFLFLFSVLFVNALQAQQTAGGYLLGYDPDGDGYCSDELLIRRRDHLNDEAFSNAVKYYLANGWVNKSRCKGFDNCEGNPNAWRMACVRPTGTCMGNISMCIGDDPPPGWEYCGFFRCIFRSEISPNPATSQLNIYPQEDLNKPVEISLVDPYGRVSKSMRVNGVVKGQVITIRTADLNPGIYRLIMKQGVQVESRNVGVKL